MLRKKTIVSILLTIVLVIPIFPGFPTTSLAAAAPLDLSRPECYTAEEGNIARLPSVRQLTNTSETRYNPNTGAGIDRPGINASFCNDSYGVPSTQVLRLTDGRRPASGTSNGYLSWSYVDSFGTNNRLYFVLNWGQPVEVGAVRCDWWTDSNVSVPNSEAKVEWLDGTVWREVTNMRNPVTGASVTDIGSLGMGNWNAVTFDAVTTSQLRLKLHRTGTITNGIGVGEWEVFGAPEPLTDAESVAQDLAWLTLPSPVSMDFTLPSTGQNGSTFTWVSNNAAIAVDGYNAVVTPPTSGAINVTMTASVSKGDAGPLTKQINVRVIFVPPTPYNLTLRPNNLGIEISPSLYGIFFEDINHSLDGGLNAQLIDNGSFQQYEWMDSVSDVKRGSANGRYSRSDTTIYAWTAVDKNGSAGTATIVSTNPLTTPKVLPGRNAAHYQPDYNIEINVTTAPTGAADTRGYGIAANGYGNTSYYNNQTPEVAINDGWNYDVSMYLRGDYSGNVRVYLESSDGTLRSNVLVFKGINRNWKQVKGILTSNYTGFTRLCVVGDAVGKFNIDFVEMRPEASKMWKNGIAGGVRADMGKAMEDLKPGFMRFPGGCASEGMTESRQYFWKDTVGPIEERRGMPNYWGYWSSQNIGFYEYFCIAEALGAEPVPVISFGITCQFHNGSGANAPRFEAPYTGANREWFDALYVQDALDLIEFANGDPETNKWAALRAEMGHPEPFNLKMVALGNENGGMYGANFASNGFWQRFDICYKALKDAYPDLEVITNADYLSSGTYFDRNYAFIDQYYPNTIVDEHYYMGNDWFLSNTGRYDVGTRRGGGTNTYDRAPGKPRVFVGEYANGNNGTGNTLSTALAEAYFTTGLERNSDMVLMACYAPIYCKNSPSPNNWNGNLIWHDNTGIWRTCNYYYQKLFSNNVGDRWLNAEDGARETFLMTRAAANDGNVRTAPSIDTKTGKIYCKIVNNQNTAKETTVMIEGKPSQWYYASYEYISNSSTSIRNQNPKVVQGDDDHFETVKPIKVKLGKVNNSFILDLPVNSIGALVLTPTDPPGPFDIDGDLLNGNADLLIINNQDVTVNINVIIASYDSNNRMVNCDVEPVDIAPNSMFTYLANVKNVKNAAYTQLFVWDRNTFVPYMTQLVE